MIPRKYWVGLLERVCTLLFVVMTLLLFVQVVLRYIFSASLFWAEEVARYAMVWIVFVGAVVATWQGAHTRIGFFVDLLPAVPRRVVEGSVTLICAAASGLIAWHGIGVFKVAMLTKSPALGLPLGIVYGAVPLSCGVIACIMLVRSIAEFRGRMSDISASGTSAFGAASSGASATGVSAAGEEDA